LYDYDDCLRRAWPAFLEAIQMGRTLTYTELAGRAGPPLNRRQVHRQLLSPLSARCRAAGLPDLSALVVRKDSGRPGGGWFAGRPTPDAEAVWADALAACYRHRWPPGPDPRLAARPDGRTLGKPRA